MQILTVLRQPSLGMQKLTSSALPLLEATAAELTGSGGHETFGSWSPPRAARSGRSAARETCSGWAGWCWRPAEAEAEATRGQPDGQKTVIAVPNDQPLIAACNQKKQTLNGGKLKKTWIERSQV